MEFSAETQQLLLCCLATNVATLCKIDSSGNADVVQLKIIKKTFCKIENKIDSSGNE
jgi:hypothetical protein